MSEPFEGPNPDPTRRGDLPGRLVVISGASGSGKSTLVGRLLALDEFKDRLGVSISATTRAPRPGEVDGINYHFLTPEAFRSGVDRDEFLEWAEVHGQLYGTPIGPIRSKLAEGVSVILVIDVQGAMEVRRKVPDALLIFVHAPEPELDVLESRLRSRGTDSEATIRTRLANARREIGLSDRYDHQVVNDDLGRAVAELADILNRPRP